MTGGVGLFCGAGVPTGPRVNTFVECGCCGAFHRTDFQGDCREDSERFAELPAGATEVFEDGGTAPGDSCCGEYGTCMASCVERRDGER